MGNSDRPPVGVSQSTTSSYSRSLSFECYDALPVEVRAALIASDYNYCPVQITDAMKYRGHTVSAVVRRIAEKDCERKASLLDRYAVELIARPLTLKRH